MCGRTHKVGGICLGVVTGSLLLEQPYTLNKLVLITILLIGSIIGSLLPDIDHTGSTIGKKFKLISTILNSFGHRGITHTPIIHFLLFILALMLGENLTGFLKLSYVAFVVGVFVGAISHIILDSMTISGVPIFFPISKKKFRIARFKTGKNEWIVSSVCIIFTLTILKIIL